MRRIRVISGSSIWPTHGGTSRAGSGPPWCSPSPMGDDNRGPADDDPGGVRVPAHAWHREECGERALLQQCGVGLPDCCPLRGPFRPEDRRVFGRRYGSDKRSVEGSVIAGITGRQPCSGNAEQCSQAGRVEMEE